MKRCRLCGALFEAESVARGPMNTAEALAQAIAEWMQDGKPVDDEALLDAHTLVATLRLKGWQFHPAVGRADYTGRVPRP